MNKQNVNQLKEDCDLELIPPETSNRSVGKVQLVLVFIENLWQKAIAAITQTPELKIWQKHDRHGHIHWHVYDPQTGESVSFASEATMHDWIENRYCR